MRPQDLISFLTFSIENNFSILVKGKPGIGKSDIGFQAKEEWESMYNKKALFILWHPVVSDPTDFKGLPFYRDGDTSAHFVPFGELNTLINPPEGVDKVIVFIDDFGQASVSVQAAVMQLLLAKQINGFPISKKVTFLSATNRKEDKAGVSGLLEPVKSRFASIVELDVNTDDWVMWALNHNMPVELISFVRFKPDQLEKFTPTKDITNSPCPRSVANIGKMQNAGIKKELEFEAYRGAVGEGFAVEYCAFLKIFRDLPSIDQIIMNPKGTNISDEPGVLYALAGLIGHKMTDQNQEALITYLDRLPAEISVVSMKDALTRNKALALTKPYIKWSTKHGNLIA